MFTAQCSMFNYQLNIDHIAIKVIRVIKLSATQRLTVSAAEFICKSKPGVERDLLLPQRRQVAEVRRVKIPALFTGKTTYYKYSTLSLMAPVTESLTKNCI